MIGDVRNFADVSVLRNADVVVNAAALKPSPYLRVLSRSGTANQLYGGIQCCAGYPGKPLPNIVRRRDQYGQGCKPVNVMGMTKSLQERSLRQPISSNPIRRPSICVRYGNVLASRGSVIPLFRDQIRTYGGPVTVTVHGNDAISLEP